MRIIDDRVALLRKDNDHIIIYRDLLIFSEYVYKVLQDRISEAVKSSETFVHKHAELNPYVFRLDIVPGRLDINCYTKIVKLKTKDGLSDLLSEFAISYDFIG